MLLSESRIVVIAGKGGVGKTTTAAAMAVASARQGIRTLVISTDPAHSLSDVLERPCGSSATAIEANLDTIEINTEEQTLSHVRDVARALKKFSHPDSWPEIDRQMTAAARAPGTMEAALVDYLADLLPGALGDYQKLVLDTAPTGHTLRLLSLPAQLGQRTETLMHQRQEHDRIARRMGTVDRQHHQEVAERLRTRKEKLDTARQLLGDRSITSALVVLTPERLPILESLRLVHGLEQAGLHVAGLVVNGLLPNSSSDPFLVRRRQRQQHHLADICRQFPGLARVQLELAADDPSGPDLLAEIGDRLLAGLD